MKRLPLLPTWLLKQLGCGASNDAVLGDLAERYQKGESVVWYYRQTLFAILSSAFHDLQSRKLLALRAVFGAFLVVACTELFVARHLGDLAGVNASADGTFEILNVPPGSYDLFARLPVANGWGGLAPPERATTPLAIGRTSVEVRSGSVEGVTILVHQGVDVKGRLTVDGQPPAANSIRVSLAPDDSATRVGEAQISNVFGQIAQYPPPNRTGRIVHHSGCS
jgi:hypothetical protein